MRLLFLLLGLLLAQSALADGVPVDAYRQPGDADDTAAFVRAAGTWQPLILSARTYRVRDFSTGTIQSFILRGVPGKSVIQRSGGVTGAFFRIDAANVSVDGVTFDMNKAAVPFGQWGVLLKAGGQAISVRNSVFKNATDSCFAITSTGPAAGGSFVFADNEVTNCGNHGAFFGSVAHGVVRNNWFHDSPTRGVYIGPYGAVSATNFSAWITVEGNRFARNATGIAIGGFAPPYVFGTPSAVGITVANNTFVDNTGYQLIIQGDNVTARGNSISESASPPVGMFGSILCNARYSLIDGNTISTVASVSGIDCGGSDTVRMSNNSISLVNGVAFNLGASVGATIANNRIVVADASYGIMVSDTDGDSNNVPMPTPTSGLTIEDNTIVLRGGGVPIGIYIPDNAGGRPNGLPVIIRRNHFFGGASSQQSVVHYGSADSLVLDGNDHNGTSVCYVDPDASGFVNFSLICDEVRTVSATAPILSVQPTHVAANGSGSRIFWAYPVTGGAGYSDATTLTLTAPTGTGAEFTPKISQGVIIGVSVKTRGSGYSGALTLTASDPGGGSGATFVVGNKPAIPSYRRIRFTSTAGNVLRRGGGYMGLASNAPLLVGPYGSIVLEAVRGGAYWTVSGYSVPTYAVGTLPACDGPAAGIAAHVSGSVTGKWQARCNGTNWVWPDGTTVVD